MKLHAPLALPILCSLAATVLAFLVLFAGKSPNSMEDAHIIMLNTSSLGKNLVPTATSGGDGDKPTSTGSACDKLGGVFGKGCSAVASAAGSVETQVADAVGDVEDDIADKLAAKLGIKEFYSLHVMDACEGDFKPNATAKDAGYNVTNCTQPLKTAQYNLTAKFDHELSVGPLHLNLADLGFTKDLQDAFNKIPHLLMALAVVYILAAGFTGLSLLASLAAVPLINNRSSPVVMVNLGVAGLAVMLLLVGSLTTTVGVRGAAKTINDLGEDFGLRATAGGKFLGMTWAAAGLMVVAVAYWVWELLQSRKRRRTDRSEEKIGGGRYSAESYNQPRYQPEFPARY